MGFGRVWQNAHPGPVQAKLSGVTPVGLADSLLGSDKPCEQWALSVSTTGLPFLACSWPPAALQGTSSTHPEHPCHVRWSVLPPGL